MPCDRTGSTRRSTIPGCASPWAAPSTRRASSDAAVGDPKFWRLCKTYYGCGTPLASDKGTAGLLEGNVDKAKALLKEAGYDGRPIVLLQVTHPRLARQFPAPSPRRSWSGSASKVDMRPADWQTHLARVMRKEPPEDRGWNITLSSTGVIDVVNPITSLFLNSACDKASAGWSCDAQIEAMRDAFCALEPDAAKRKAIAEEIQERALQVGTHYPLGEWYSASAVSARTKGWIRPALDDRLLERRGREALKAPVGFQVPGRKSSSGTPKLLSAQETRLYWPTVKTASMSCSVE